MMGNWINAAGVTDSGAVAPGALETTAEWIQKVETTASRQRAYYFAAGGSKLYNEGNKSTKVSQILEHQCIIKSKWLMQTDRYLQCVKVKRRELWFLLGVHEEYGVVPKKTGKVLYEVGEDVVVSMNCQVLKRSSLAAAKKILYSFG
jgi:hypothetical protein